MWVHGGGGDFRFQITWSAEAQWEKCHLSNDLKEQWRRKLCRYLGKDILVRRKRSPGEEADRFRGRSFAPQSCFCFFSYPFKVFRTPSLIFFPHSIYALLTNCNNKIWGDCSFFGYALVACKIWLPTRDQISVPWSGSTVLTPWTTRKVPGELVFI